MKSQLVFVAGFSTMLLFGCATQPEQVPGAGSLKIDPEGVNMRRYQLDLADCKGLASGAQNDSGRRAAVRAGGGALLGGALGAIAGDSSSAALAGAGIGALAGGVSGISSASSESGRIVRNCLVGRGYRVLN
ncbi:MAG: glycine zipper family protein [Gammaproteobacteria bacterium]|nr:glycine zipper family protein [Gammaproteobacteria bacterium]